LSRGFQRNTRTVRKLFAITEESYSLSRYRQQALELATHCAIQKTILNWKEALEGAKRLKSEGFCDGALETHDQMKLAFPDEQEVKNLLDNTGD
jgi:hypothetical protein